jgi:hypothetical protein
MRLLCDGTGAETSFRLSVEWTSPCILAGGDSSVRYCQPWCARQLVTYLLPVAKTLISIVKISLQEGKKRVKKSSERETIYNVHKFMELSEVGITIPLSSVQKRAIEATRVCRRTVCRRVKEGENVKHGVGMPFSTPRKLRPKDVLKVS